MKLKNYYKPTPVFWRKIGDCLLSVSLFVTGSGILLDKNWVAIPALVIGVVGKFLTNFFSDDKEKPK